ncbi:MAG: ATP-binding cassette domain-containing protein [Rikenellaceae bacterium]|jgi:phospholipid/cholesterol/gamma-HCH transport system ATP-binding protein|nr:ATP-binding cassette domain-containing protein [Rikenellaceae bacterium]
MIHIDKLVKQFDGQDILRGVDATFEQGKTNLIIGQSGSGKTVLLKCIVGLHPIDGGAIYYDEVCFSSLDNSSRRGMRRDMGMIFQGGALFDSQTVEENVKFPLDLFSSQSEAEKRERVQFCLNRVNLNGAGRLYPSEISGGMIKRAAIARAIVLNPKYLFCDEPNSGLDPKTSVVIDGLIAEITAEYNMTTIINTHDMNSVRRIGDTIIFIYQGNKLWQGTKEEIGRSDNRELNDYIFAAEVK